jgi:hypothetical protein
MLDPRFQLDFQPGFESVLVIWLAIKFSRNDGGSTDTRTMGATIVAQQLGGNGPCRQGEYS